MRRVSNIALIAAAGIAILAVGGVHTTIVGIAGALALVAFALQVGHLRAHDHRSVYVSSVGVGLLLAAIVSFLQLIPVPELIQKLLSPHGWGIVTTGFDAAGLEGPGWRPLSMDPAATADRALRFTALAAFSLAGANVYMRHGWRPASRAVIGLAIACAGVGGVLWVTDAHSILGMYATEVGFRKPSTFVNTNHGAVLYGFAAIVAATLAFDVRSRRPRETAFAGGAAAVFVALCLFHNSEGTTLALLATGVLGGVLGWFRAGRPVDVARPTLVALVAIAVLAIAMGIWLDIDRAVVAYVERVVFGGEHGNRLALVTAGLSAAADYWPIGAGIGTTKSVIPAYVDWTQMIPASIPVLENDSIELLMGAGLLFGPVILAALLVTAVMSVRPAADAQRSNRFVVAVLVAFYGLVIAQMHFPLFTLGLGAPMVAFVEVAWSRRMRSSEGSRLFGSGHLAAPTSVALMLVLLLGIAIAGASHAHFSTFQVQTSTTPGPQEAARLLRLRPADHRTYVRLAVAAARDGRPEAASRLAKLAMEREPSPRVRLFLARAFALHDPQASMAEYRRLFEDVAPGGVFLRSMLADISRPEARAELVGGHPDRWWAVTTEILGRDGPEPASSFVVALVGDHPTDVDAYRVATRLYTRLGQFTLARLWAELLEQLERDLPPKQRTAAIYRAKALAAEGRHDEARRELSRSAREGAADDVHRFALQLRGALKRADPEHVENVRKHYGSLCASPIAEENLKLCWETEAWLAEADGDFVETRRVLDRLRRRFDAPVPLAEFYHRAGQCRRIEALLAQTEPDAPGYGRIERLMGRCTPVFE